jgi:hypothetical protein
MTVDERLERLTERHEALTQSVELMRLEGQEQNKRIDNIVGLMESLTLIVQSHERRPGDIEGQK